MEPLPGHNATVARVFVGVTGGIAAYKACELVRLLVKAGHDVVPLVTHGAQRFVSEETFLALARKGKSEVPYPHLERADLLVVAPLTAHTLARLAHGLADDVLTEAALAHDGPVLVAPAMNPRMWAHEATQANLATLLARGVELVGPEEGELAEGDIGPGRMAEPAAIFERADALLSPGSPGPAPPAGPLRNLHVLVSAGGTREPLDAVRYVGNRSSGRMGVEIAREAVRRGARVTLLAANLTVAAPDGVEVVETPTAADVEREALSRSTADVIVMAAAVADYRPARTLQEKRPKDDRPWSVELEPTTDVMRALGSGRANGQVLVGFAAETGRGGLERARAKLADKKADLFVFNDVSRDDIAFDALDNEVTLLSAASERSVGRRPKREVAVAVLDEIERLLAAR
jgi:phosphopantothenoylcysteine decarboxylase / phosphopantothenate---cysteine ligase